MIELTDSQEEMMKAIKKTGKWTASRDIFLALYDKSTNANKTDFHHDLKSLVKIGYVVQTEDVDSGVYLYKAKH